MDTFAFSDPTPEPVPVPTPAPAPPVDRGAWLWIALIALLLISRGGCTLPVTIVSAPPFPADKPCVMVSADLSIAGDEALGKTHRDVVSAVVKWAKSNGGEYWLDDTNQKTPPTNEAAWLQEAWKVADRSHPPSIVAASKSRGVAPQSLPTKPDEATKLLDSLK